MFFLFNLQTPVSWVVLLVPPPIWDHDPSEHQVDEFSSSSGVSLGVAQLGCLATIGPIIHRAMVLLIIFIGHMSFVHLILEMFQSLVHP